MAIYHFKAKVITRSHGKGCVASAAYQARDSFKDQSINQTFNYRHKGADHQSGFILAPDGAPAWMLKAESLWNGVESFEDALLSNRFRGDHKDPDKRQKSLDAREKALSSAQTAWTSTIALPRELTDHQNETLLRSYLQDHFVKHGLVVQCDIHKDPGNPHAHIMVTMRAVEGDSFARTKLRPPGSTLSFFNRDHLKNVLRAGWAESANRMLERCGWDTRIDHRTLEDQGISRAPTRHEGYAARLLESQGSLSRIVTENHEIESNNLSQYLANPALIINDLAREKVVFSKQDIITFLHKHAGHHETLFVGLKQALSEVKLPAYLLNAANDNGRFDSEDVKQELDDLLRDGVAYILKNEALVSLGESVFQQELFTSKEQRQRESATLALIKEAAGNTAASALKDTAVAQAIEKIEAIEKSQAVAQSEAKTGFTYSDEQRQAIGYLTSGGQLKVLEGRAGTGKSTVLKPVVEAYRQAGYRVMGAAFQGIIADALATELGIPAHTLDKYTHQWGATQKAMHGLVMAKGETKAYLRQQLKHAFFYEPDAKTVLIVDEGSMVKHDHYHKLLDKITKTGAKLIVVQDQQQFKALTGADISAELSQHADAVYLKGVLRQQIPWQRQATALLNQHRMEEGLSLYESHHRLHLADNHENAKAALLTQYLKDLKAYPQERLTILAFENRHVDFFNTAILQTLLQEGHVKDPFTINGRSFAIGAPVLFTRNDHGGMFVKTVHGKGRGVKNGSFGVISGYDQKAGICEVRLETDRLVRFKTQDYASLSLGYAMTTMKSQGKTVFQSYSYMDKVRSANDLLVSLSRHRDDGFIYASKEHYPSFRELAKAASASQYQGLAEAYAVTAQEKPYYELVKSYKEATRQVGQLGFALVQHRETRTVDDSTTQAFERAKSERQVLAKQILSAYPRCHPYLKQGRIGIETLEEHAGLRARLYTLPEQQALARVEQFFDAALAAKTLRADMLQTHPGPLVRQHEAYAVYERYVTVRNTLAYEIAKAKPLHRPFFVTHPVTVGTDQDPLLQYETKGGQRYAQKPPSMTTCLTYAERYEATLQQAYFKETLFGERRAFYNQYETYQAAVRSYGAAYATIKNHAELLQAPGNADGLKEVMHRHAETRDRAALGLVRAFMADRKGDLEHLAQQLHFKQDTLLQHAVQGEAREIIQAYDKASTIEARLLQAGALYQFVFGADGKTCDKRLYALAKERGIDWHQVRFERRYGLGLQAGQRPRYGTLDDLKAAYAPTPLVRVSAQTPVAVNAPLTTDPLYASQSSSKRQVLEGGYGTTTAVFKTNKPQPRPELSSYEWQGLCDRISEAAATHPGVRHHLSTRGPERVIPSRHEVRYGRKGSFVLKTGGPKAGIYYNHEADEGGNLIQYCQREMQMSFKDAMLYLAPAASYEDQQTIKQLFDPGPRERAMEDQKQRATLPAQEGQNKAGYGTAVTVKASSPSAKAQLSSYEWQGLCDRISEAAATHPGVRHHLSTRGPERVIPSRHEVRYGRKGSFVLKTGGPKAGIYYNHEADEGGNLIQYCQREMQMSFKDAMLYLAPAASYEDQQTIKQLFDPGPRERAMEDQQQRAARLAQEGQNKAAQEAQLRENQQQERQQQKQRDVATLVSLSAPLQGTQGETYLRETRHIQGSLPPSLRYLPAGTTYSYEDKERVITHGALLSLAHHVKTGELQAVQITYLDGHGKRPLDQEGTPFIKAIHGQLSGAMVTIQADDHSNRVLLAEGVETALSIKAAGIQGTILCSLGTSNLKNLDSEGKDVVLLADWDGDSNTPSWHALKTAQETLQQKNNHVSIVLPVNNPALTKEKLDFNDVLRQQGLSSLQALLAQQGLVGNQGATYLDKEGTPSHEQTDQLSQTSGTPKHDSLAPAQQEHSSDAVSGSTTNEPILSQDVPEETAPSIQDQKPVDALDAEAKRALQFLEGKNINPERIENFKNYLNYNTKEALEVFKETWKEFAEQEQSIKESPRVESQNNSLQEEAKRAIQFLEGKNINPERIENFKNYLDYNTKEALEVFKETWKEFAEQEQGQPYEAVTMPQTQPINPVQELTEKIKILDGVIDFYARPGGDERSLNKTIEQRDDLFKEISKDTALMETLKQQKPDIHERIQNQEETQFRGMTM